MDNEETPGFEQNNDAEVDMIEDVTTSSTATSGFLNLPFDVLAEILIMTEHPGDVLAVARTSKQLCNRLVSPAAGFIWKKARIAVGLPDPAAYSAQYELPICYDNWTPHIVAEVYEVIGVGYFMGCEPAYAAFVFDGGICEVRLVWITWHSSWL